MFKFNKLLGRMREVGYSQTAMAKELGISANAFTNKVKGRSNFTQIEILSMCDKLDIDSNQIGAYFFTV